jgi:hypothetical protein
MLKDHESIGLVPDCEVLKEFDITPMTLWRWDRDPKLDFPPAIYIRKRKFRERKKLEEFKKRMIRLATAGRKKMCSESAREG